MALIENIIGVPPQLESLMPDKAVFQVEHLG